MRFACVVGEAHRGLLSSGLQGLRTVSRGRRRRPLLPVAASELVSYPQVLVNVRVKQKTDLRSVPAIAQALDRVEQRLAGQGRLLVRYSGTEPLVRVMIEGKDQKEIHAWAQEIADTVKQHLG